MKAHPVATETMDSNSPWAPLRSGTFRTLWLAMSAANIGTAMQVVGAQSLIIGGPGRAANADMLVTLVQAAAMLPVLLLGLPAGVLADLVDRRRLLIRVQLGIAVVCLLLAGLALAGELQSTALLVLQCALGAGAALTMPAYGSLTPELVPRRHLPQASALAAISANVARAAGPAAAGLLIAQIGASAVFALHAVTVITFVAVLIAWRPERSAAPRREECFGSAMRAGWQYVRHTPVVRRLLVHALLFLVPGSALLALLPLLAGSRLGLGVDGYGLLLGAVGAGAIAGAFIQPRLRAVRPKDRIAISAATYLVALVVVAVSRDPITVAAVLVAAGAAWVIALTYTNAAIESVLPSWVRARGLAVYQVVLFGGQGLGTVGWGYCAHSFGLRGALLLAATGLGIGVAAGRCWPVPDVSRLGRRPAPLRPGPRVVREAGPILVGTNTAPWGELVRHRRNGRPADRASRRTDGLLRSPGGRPRSSGTSPVRNWCPA
ncbi:MFS transporter [Dactylosporangium fulvum]|uniref:MFS transporter n=1 Tax=Dactylosporangium fulvum TaxID=53359 RepID=A0ABY5VPK9_9ACTN|nr:MFS transporter [Dactylosporangium fulvum]UWP79039.1 MFS transporter [Dactylosporangium fulvum]